MQRVFLSVFLCLCYRILKISFIFHVILTIYCSWEWYPQLVIVLVHTLLLFCFTITYFIWIQVIAFAFQGNKSLRLLSYNVRGLRDAYKRQELVSRLLYPLNEKPPDIFAFQETHSDDQEVHTWKIKADLYCAHGSNVQRGVLIGIRHGVRYQCKKCTTDPQGRFVILNLVLEDQSLTLVSLYLEPSLTPSEITNILMQINQVVDEYGNHDVVWCGDFNVILNPELDMVNRSTSHAHKSQQLNGFIDTNELTDIWRAQHPTDRRYTCFVRNKMSRLDLMLISPTMLPTVVNSWIGFSYHSDHAPLYMDFSTEAEVPGNSFWRMPNFLVSDPQFTSDVKNLIKDQIHLNAGADPALLWDSIKASIRGLGLAQLARYKRIRKNKIEGVEKEIAETVFHREKFADNSDFYEHYTSKLKFLQIELDDIYVSVNAAASAYKKARTYYSSGRNTKYQFQGKRSPPDVIRKLRTPWGVIVDTNKDVLNECHRFYKKLYRQPAQLFNRNQVRAEILAAIPSNLLTAVDKELLGKPLTQGELYLALQEMKIDKSPGLDSLTVEFYRKFWPWIKTLVYNSVQYAFRTHSLSISQRRGIIKLIPKKNKDPSEVKNWRPITLLNVDYKLITKSLASRVANILPRLIHKDQKGFVKNRYIGNNVLDVYSLIAKAEEMDEELILILLDIQKAFDSISWSFIEAVLDKFGFPPTFISWMITLYKGKELRIINNGVLSEAINPTRGLVQGCGLSPLIFILAMEALAGTIRKNPRIQ